MYLYVYRLHLSMLVGICMGAHNIHTCRSGREFDSVIRDHGRDLYVGMRLF